MSNESQQPVSDIMGHLERLTAVLDEQRRAMDTQSFDAVDETGTVEVTLDGRLRLVNLEIEEGLLRLGAPTVEQRINEALLSARAGGSEGITAQQEKFIEDLSGVAEEMTRTVQAQFQKAVGMGLIPAPQFE
jgi:DNA-binding protein YbaB